MGRKDFVVVISIILLFLLIILSLSNSSAISYNPNPNSNPEPDHGCYWSNKMRICCYESQQKVGDVNIGDRVCCYDSDGANNFDVKGYLYLKIKNGTSFIMHDSCTSGDPTSAYDLKCPAGFPEDIYNSDIYQTQESVGQMLKVGIPSQDDSKENSNYQSLENIGGEKGVIYTPLTTEPRVPYTVTSCPKGCSRGRCSTISPAIDITAEFVITNGLLAARTQCAVNTNKDGGVKTMSVAIAAQDPKGKLIVDDFFSTPNSNINCYGTYCLLGSLGQFMDYPYNDENYAGAFPGTWAVSCTGSDSQNTRQDTVVFGTSCTPPYCDDMGPPVISLSFESISESKHLVWLDIDAYDTISGTNYMIINVTLNDNTILKRGIKCQKEKCTFYSLLEGQGNWKATLVVYDLAGNMIGTTKEYAN